MGLGQFRNAGFRRIVSSYSTRTPLSLGSSSKWVGSSALGRLSQPTQYRVRSPFVLGAVGVRFNSTVAPTPPEQLVSGLTEGISKVTDATLATTVDPNAALKLGDFAALGLCNYTPVGLLEKGMELLAVGGLPWWGIIPVLTLGIRFACFPLMIKMNHATTRMNNIRPDMEAITKRLQRAQLNKDAFECQVQSQRLQALFKEHKIKPFAMFIAPLVQAPVMISFFLGLKAMAEANVPGFSTGGLSWFTDLTAADPYYILPVISSLGLLASMELGAMMNPAVAASNPEWVRWAFRCIALISLPATANLPTAIFCYWVPSNLFSILQTFLLNNLRFRKIVGLPKLIQHPPPGPAVLTNPAQVKTKKVAPRLTSA